MRVVATVQPGAGHLLPVVPLCRALREAGHDVLVACSSSLLPVVRDLGLSGAAVGPDWSWGEPERLLGRPSPADIDSERRTLADAVEVARFAVLSDLRRLLADVGADVVLHEQYESAGPLAAELAGLPCLCLGHGYSPFVNGAVAPDAPTRPVRAALGLPLRPDPMWPYAYADSFPESLHPFAPDPTPWRWPLRPVPVSWGAGQPAWPPASGPRVPVTLGTVMRSRSQLLPVAAAGAAAAGAATLVLGDDARLGPAEQVRSVRMSALAPLLAQADLAVTHGGTGSTVAALAAGVPLLVLPGHDEQRYLGFRVAGAGAGLVLPDGRSTVEGVRGAVQTVLAEPAYRWNARRLAAEIAAMPAQAETVRRLEQLADLPGRPTTNGVARRAAAR